MIDADHAHYALFLLDPQDDPVLATPGAAEAYQLIVQALPAGPRPPLPTLAVSVTVAVLTALVLPLRWVWPGPVFGVMVLMAAVLAQWPVRGARDRS